MLETSSTRLFSDKTGRYDLRIYSLSFEAVCKSMEFRLGRPSVSSFTGEGMCLTATGLSICAEVYVFYDRFILYI
jgi:hypothetical protein